MQTIELSAGSTFSFAGTVKNLDGSVAWGLSSSVRVAGASADLDTFVCSLAHASDFLTTGNWNLSLSATAAQTLMWYNSAKNQRGELMFDLKFFNTAGADPVIRSAPIKLLLSPAITP